MTYFTALVMALVVGAGTSCTSYAGSGSNPRSLPQTSPVLVTQVEPVKDRGAEPAAAVELPDPGRQGVDLLRELPSLTVETRRALEAHRRLLRRQPTRKRYRFGDREVSSRQLIDVVDRLLKGQDNMVMQTVSLSEEPTDVHFTGYYSPVVRVRKSRDSVYRYPFLARPRGYSGKLPSRWSIERDTSLLFDTLALAWAAHPLDVYTMQLQGSGYVEYEDGTREYFAYGGTNKYPYQSLELALKRHDPSVSDLTFDGIRDWMSEDLTTRDSVTTFNPNYGFFRRAKGAPRGAAGIRLTELVSVAADPSHYPLGSILLATTPNARSTSGSPVVRLLLVQDTGGAVRGDAHLDLYTGVGRRGLQAAERIFESGEVYALLPE